MDFNQLAKAAKKISPAGLHKLRLAILGDSSTQFLAKAVRNMGRLRSLDIEIYEGNYGQIESEALNSSSGLYAFKPDLVLVFRSSLRLKHIFYSLGAAAKETFASDQAAGIAALLSAFRANGLKAKAIFTSFELYDDGVYGNYYSKVPGSFYFQVSQLNSELLKLSSATEDLFVVDVNRLIQRKGAAYARDWAFYVNSDLHYSLDFHVDLAREVTGLAGAFAGRFKKCVILDLDNTLWGGVIGDDGLQNIQIGTLGIGRAFSELQKWLKQLKNRGIILAVCSKNSEETAKEPFEKHRDMELSLDDIAVFVANWNNKADNIGRIRDILNIGFDSMVFIDDNPAERELVRQNHPEIAVPELPEDPAQYLDFLVGLNLFETASASDSDAERTVQYRQESERSRLKASLANMDDYLRSLEMRGHIRPFRKEDFPRLAQLSQRSNQFNLRTARHSEGDIAGLAEDSGCWTYAVSLSDRFGDYGLISMAIVKKNAPGQAFVDTWIMSCRVLKRDVEKFLLNAIMADLAKAGIDRLVGEYLPTPKNALAEKHYAELGFSPAAGLWELAVAGYRQLEHRITPI